MIGTWLLVALAGWLAGCGGASTNIVGPAASKCQVSVAAGTTSFPAAGATGSLNVNTDRECSWSATSAAAWVVFTSAASGQGSATVAFSVAANPAAAARSASLQINDQQVQLSQAAAPCRFSLDRTSATVGAEGGSDSVTVSSLAGCSWSASSSDRWVAVQGSGSGSGRATFVVSPNSGPPRSATLTIAGVAFTISQQGSVTVPAPPAPMPSPTPAPAPAPAPTPTPPPPPPAPCTFSISPGHASLPAAGGTVSVSVTTAKDCTWTASSDASWLRIDSGASGTGSGAVTASATANPTASRRTGTLTVAGQSFTVTQDGLPPVTVSGLVSGVSGACPSLTFQVSAGDGADGTTVVTSVDTRFTGGACGDVKEGARVEATGVQGTDGRVTASTVQIQKKAKT